MGFVGAIQMNSCAQDKSNQIRCIDDFTCACTQQVKDASGLVYKYIGHKNDCSTHWACVDHQIIFLADVVVLIDSIETEESHQIDSTLRAFFWNKVSRPCHGGDPNYAIASFIVDQSGRIILFTILENLKNVCDCTWEIRYEDRAQFKPGLIDGKAIEYIMKVNCPGYCICDTIEKSAVEKVKKKRLKRNIPN
jgi:hypothetical protein